MADGLIELIQADFASGMWQGVAPHLIPPDGVLSIVNGLLDEDGSPYERGGVAYQTAEGLGTRGLRWVWDGIVAGGHRTLVAGPDKFGVLAQNRRNLIDLQAGVGLSRPPSSAVLDGILHIGGLGMTYGGSRLTADYATGTVKVVHGSNQVHGTGTSWNDNADDGMLLRVQGTKRDYAVKTIDSDGTLTLFSGYAGPTVEGKAYTLKRFGTSPKTADVYGAIAERLIVCVGNKAWFSDSRDADGLLHPDSFPDGNWHELPDGVEIIGFASIEGVGVYFTTGGVWAAYNMALDQVDPLGNIQERVDRINEDMILWGAAGLSTWRGDLIVPARDGVYLFDPQGAPAKISNSISRLISVYVAAGFRPGQAAVHNSHYFLPVLDAEGNVQDLLVCRLDRPVRRRSGMAAWPWVRITGQGGRMAAVASSGPSGQLYGALRDAPSKVMRLTDYFDPDSAGNVDADGTNKTMVIETRAIDTGGESKASFVKMVQVRAEQADDDAPLQAAATVGEREAGVNGIWDEGVWDEMLWGGLPSDVYALLELVTPGSVDGRRPFVWRFGKRARFVRVRVASSGPSGKFTLRSITLKVRASAKDR